MPLFLASSYPFPSGPIGVPPPSLVKPAHLLGFVFGIISGIFLLAAVGGNWTVRGLNAPEMPYLYALLPFGIIILLCMFFIFLVPLLTTHKSDTSIFIATIFSLGLLAFILCIIGIVHAVAAGAKGIGSAGPIGITGAVFAILAALLYEPLSTIKNTIKKVVSKLISR